MFFEIADDYQKIAFSSSPERAKKGWSYSNVYYLRDIKDIYLVLNGNPSLKTVADVYTFCLNYDIVSEGKKAWTERAILEIINSLKNFELVDSTFTPLRGVLFESGINEGLTPSDYGVFKTIFYSYFRFKDFIRLFEETDCFSGVVFPFMENCRFVNRLALIDLKTVYYIDDSRSEIMRFWDVFLKWGLTLSVLDRVAGMILFGDITYSTSAVYFVREMPSSFSIISAIEDLQMGSYIYIPDALKQIAVLTHFPIKTLVNKLVTECYEDSKYCLQSTSAIFVPTKDKHLFPVIDNTYMSHLLKLY